MKKALSVTLTSEDIDYFKKVYSHYISREQTVDSIGLLTRSGLLRTLIREKYDELNAQGLI